MKMNRKVLLLKKKKYLIPIGIMSTIMSLSTVVPAFAEKGMEMVYVGDIVIPMYVEYYDSETSDLGSDG